MGGCPSGEDSGSPAQRWCDRNPRRRTSLTSFACSRTDEPPRALLGSGFLVNNVG